MIPSITPPTDNLYKFISLFGLTILLFSLYNLGINFDHSAKNRMQIEDVKTDLQQVLYKKSEKLNDNLKAESVKNHFRPGKIRRMSQDLVEIEHLIETSNLNPKEEIEFSGEISKLNVALDTLRLKQYGYIFFASIGFVLMVVGFFRWHSKEQKLRDKMLAIEHAIKLLEKLHYKDGKEQKSSIVDALVKIKNSETN
jgi:hypothetical protein